MIREWLLVIWLGTSTNFSLHSVHWSLEDCQRARTDLIKTLAPEFVTVCTQDLREGRSQYPSRSGSQGIASPK